MVEREGEPDWGSFVHRPNFTTLILLRQFQELHGVATGQVCLTLEYDALTHIFHCLCPIGFWTEPNPLAILCGAHNN